MENKDKSSNEAHSEPLQQCSVVGSASFICKNCNHELTYPEFIKLFEGAEGENNGWIKIQSETDLPIKNIDCFCLSKNGDILICNSRQTHFWCSDNKWLYNFKDFTHYQPIQKPLPPKF